MDSATLGLEKKGCRFLTHLHIVSSKIRVRFIWEIGGPLIVAAFALTLWLTGLSRVDITELNGIGLIQELSPLTLVAIPVTLVACLMELHGRRRAWVLATLTALLILVIYGIQPSVQSAARIPQGWIHVGFIEYIATSRHLFVDFDARFSWPGFFVVLAYASSAVGIDQPNQLLMWAPVAMQLLFAITGRALIVAILGNTIASWYATWILLVTNWSEQDYLAPQAMALILLLGTLALVVRFLVNSDLLSPRLPSTAPPSRHEQFFVSLAIPVLGATLVVSHQITPMALIGVLLALLATRRLSNGWLVLVVTMTFVTYFILGADTYWASRLSRLLSGVGDLSEVIGQGLFQRATTSSDPLRQVIIGGRVGLTLAVIGLAVAGYVALWRRRGFSIAVPLMAVAAGGVAVIQPYGGEILIRAYLYLLIFAALGGAIALCEAFRPFAGTDSARRLGSTRFSLARRAIALVVLTLFALVTVTVRGGNDAFVGITQNDVKAVHWIYAEARPGAKVAAPFWQPPLLNDRIEDTEQVSRDQLAQPENPCSTEDELRRCLAEFDPDFVVLSPQQEAAGIYTGGLSPGWMLRLQGHLTTDDTYTMVHTEGKVTILEKAATSG